MTLYVHFPKMKDQGADAWQNNNAAKTKCISCSVLLLVQDKNSADGNLFSKLGNRLSAVYS